jgi:hypothetical protein
MPGHLGPDQPASLPDRSLQIRARTGCCEDMHFYAQADKVVPVLAELACNRLENPQEHLKELIFSGMTNRQTFVLPGSVEAYICRTVHDAVGKPVHPFSLGGSPSGCTQPTLANTTPQGLGLPLFARDPTPCYSEQISWRGRAVDRACSEDCAPLRSWQRRLYPILALTRDNACSPHNL